MSPVEKIGSPILRRRRVPLSFTDIRRPSFRFFLKKMVSAMRAHHGVGIAANQLGRPCQALAMECRANQRYPGRGPFSLEILINPRVIKASKKLVTDWEGCLSIPGYRAKVPRAARITYTALTDQARPVLRTVTGFKARVLQHEMDHLNGLFYLYRVKDLCSLMHWEVYNRRVVIQKRIHGEKGVYERKKSR